MTFVLSVNDVCIKVNFKSNVDCLRTAILRSCTLTLISSLTDCC